MGLVDWFKLHSKAVNRYILLGLVIFDSYLLGLIYQPTEMAKIANDWREQLEIVADPLDSPSASPSKALPKLSPSPTPSPVTTTTEPNPTIEPSSTPTSTTNTTPTPTPVQSSIPTPTPSSTPAPTPTITPTPTPTPTPATASQVYITGYVYANNQQLIAEQYPVKVVNTQTNEIIASGETNNEGKSPTWSIAANTSIRVTLYPKPGFQGCGDEWNLTIGTLGTMETHNLSIQGNRTPCITL